MNIIQIIDKKRHGEAHTEEEIRALVEGMMAEPTADNHIADYQLSAWLMAACINGLNLDETTWLTRYFVESGEVITYPDLDGVVVDKHSTGGVGDKTTLLLLPLLAASGVKVAKLSGRGLGFTGGTIDKLEAIPGFKVSLSTGEFLDQIKRIGAAISGQTRDLAPADGRMYALRDVTCTVESIPLIAASVVSKKIAAGAEVIVIDIKYGRGAFMKNLDDARQLAETCREVGRRLGRRISTVISSMEHPLGGAIGHTVEVAEVIRTLKGDGPEDLRELCLTLGSVALVGARLAESTDAARRILQGHLDDGGALAKFKEVIAAQQGNVAVLDDVNLMPQAARIIPFLAVRSGYVADIDALKAAQAAKILGAGRYTKADQIDLGVGVVFRKKVGDAVKAGECLAEVYAGNKHYEEALVLLQEAVVFSDKPVEKPQLIADVQLSDLASV